MEGLYSFHKELRQLTVLTLIILLYLSFLYSMQSNVANAEDRLLKAKSAASTLEREFQGMIKSHNFKVSLIFEISYGISVGRYLIETNTVYSKLISI